MKKLFILILLTLGQALTAATSERDSLALVELYNSCNGNAWTNVWDLNSPVSGWSGISVINGRVTTLSLNNYNLSGALPWQLGQLDSLKSINLGSDPITGVFPDSLWNLKKLETLYLSNTSLEGSISPQIGQMKNLKTLYITSSKFSGELPAEIGNCTKLERIRLNNNQFSGELPSTLANLPALYDLYINFNNFNGPFPVFLTNNLLMTTLALEYNQFSGPIPDEIGNMTNLTWVYLAGNQFNGAIPASLGNLTKTTFLQLNDNQLTGPIPVEIGSMTSLQYIRLQSNDLSGALPQSVAAMPNLKEIRVDYCNLDSLPDLSGLTNLNKLWVQSNNFDFGDLEPQLNCPALTSYSFANQDSIDTKRSYNLSVGSAFTLKGKAGGTATVYQWYKDGQVISGQNDSVLVLQDITLADSGLYHYTATNSNLSGLTLKGRPARIKVGSDQWVIDSEEIWSGIIEVNSNLLVSSQGHLTIQPGSEVRFNGNYKIQVDGRISALGSLADSIAFYSVNQDSGWAGIVFDTLNAATDSSIFDYCIFSNGRGESGGAISIRQTDQIRISHSRFYENRGTTGGAVFIENSSPRLNENYFIGNTAIYGGAVYFSNSQSVLTFCRFYGNYADLFGGAAHFLDCFSVVANNVLTENFSGYGGALSFSYSSIQSNDNQFYGNGGMIYGGAIFANAAQINSTGDIYEWNSSPNGGAVYITFYSTLNAVSGKWMYNQALESGGAIDLSSSWFELRNSLLAQNEAENGGALGLSESSALLINNTIAGNHAFKSGGAVFMQTGDESQFINTAFALNIADSSGSDFYFDDSDNITFTNCLADSAAGFAGKVTDLIFTNNTNGDPDFWGDPQKPYGFGIFSALLNNGTTDTTGLGLPALDLAGEPRLQDGIIDIGAYEGYEVGDAIENEDPVLPVKMTLYQNFPNPFNPSTTIRFDLPETGMVKIKVYDTSGRVVTELLNAVRPAGGHFVRWDGRNRSGEQAASGLYYYQLESAGKKLAGKMLLIR